MKVMNLDDFVRFGIVMKPKRYIEVKRYYHKTNNCKGDTK